MMRGWCIAAVLLIAGSANAQPAADIAVGNRVPFSAGELRNAIELRIGDGLESAIQIAMRDNGELVVTLGQSRRSVRLTGREGETAARIVALVIIDLATPTANRSAPSATLAPTAVTRAAPPERRPIASIFFGPRMVMRNMGRSVGGSVRMTAHPFDHLGFSVDFSLVRGDDIDLGDFLSTRNVRHTSMSVAATAHVRRQLQSSGHELRLGAGARFGRHWLSGEFIPWDKTEYSEMRKTAEGNAWSPIVEASYLLPISESVTLDIHGEGGTLFSENRDFNDEHERLNGVYAVFQLLLGWHL